MRGQALTAEDREEISRGISEGFSGSAIGRLLGKHRSVVNREIWVAEVFPLLLAPTNIVVFSSRSTDTFFSRRKFRTAKLLRCTVPPVASGDLDLSAAVRETRQARSYMSAARYTRIVLRDRRRSVTGSSCWVYRVRSMCHA